MCFDISDAWLFSHEAQLAHQLIDLSGSVSDMFILGLHLLKLGNRVVAFLDGAASPPKGRIR